MSVEFIKSSSFASMSPDSDDRMKNTSSIFQIAQLFSQGIIASSVASYLIGCKEDRNNFFQVCKLWHHWRIDPSFQMAIMQSVIKASEPVTAEILEMCAYLLNLGLEKSQSVLAYLPSEIQQKIVSLTALNYLTFGTKSDLAMDALSNALDNLESNAFPALQSIKVKRIGVKLFSSLTRHALSLQKVHVDLLDNKYFEIVGPFPEIKELSLKRMPLGLTKPEETAFILKINEIFPALEILGLTCSDVSVSILDCLSQFVHLHTFDLQQSKISNEKIIEQFIQDHPKLNIIYKKPVSNFGQSFAFAEGMRVAASMGLPMHLVAPAVIAMLSKSSPGT